MCKIKSITLIIPIILLMCGSAFSTPGTWKPLKNQPTFLKPPSQCAPPNNNANCAPPLQPSSGGIFNLNLMTDGSVLVEGFAVADDGSFGIQEWKLVPNNRGSYVNGTWQRLADLPAGYGPFAHASAVLPDGRVIYEGGEYNVFNSTFNQVWSSDGAIYDPIADNWKSISPPSFFTFIPGPPDLMAYFHPAGPLTVGDASSVVLANGTFLLSNCCNFNDALLDPKTLTWTPTGTVGKNDINNEEGWTLLPNGKVLTIDTYVGHGVNGAFIFGPYPNDPTNSELYNPNNGTWHSAGSTKVSLTDPVFFEMGPAVLRPDGTVFATSDNGNTAIYNSKTGKWSIGPAFPIINGLQTINNDVGAALLPNGNVLVSTDTNNPFETPPTYFFEFDGKSLIQTATIPDAPIVAGVNMLVLPTGQILEFDFNTDMEIYTPNNRQFKPAWAPVINKAPKAVKPGGHYVIKGIRFNGMSQSAIEGDDFQEATNYPLVRITNLRTKHVFYCRTHDHSFMGVASNKKVKTHFDVPKTQELGPSKLEVVANGIPSKPLFITVSRNAADNNDSENNNVDVYN